MRQAAVLDVGCHSALLTVARHKSGGVEPVFSRKVRLRLHETLDPSGRLGESGVRSVQRAVAETLEADRWNRLPKVFAFATSVIRDAPNRKEVIAQVARATGTRLRVLPGEEEARLAYVAARQWAGPEQDPLLVLDIGGGTVEIAAGGAGQPDTVCSLPLGARAVTRGWLPGGVARSQRQLTVVRDHLRRSLETASSLPQAGPGVRVLACSKTFEQLAALAASQAGLSVTEGRLTLPQVREVIPLLAATRPDRRGRLPGISRHRGEQSLAGALVAEALMDCCGVQSVEISPWSTREGLLMERLGVTPAAPSAG